MSAVQTRSIGERFAPKRLAVLGMEVGANVAAVLILFQVYKLARRTFIERGETLGYQHADQIVNLEKRLHLFFELDLQRWAIESTTVIRSFNYMYSYMMWIFLTCLGLMIVFAHEKYKFWRNVFFCSMVLALPWFALYPLAPPRFMTDLGFIDTLAVYGPQYFKDSGMVQANRFAAMPSMHCGWTLIAACMLTVTLKKYVGRWAYIPGAALAGGMFLTVMVTGNHWWIDGVVGWGVVGASYLMAQRLPGWWLAFKSKLGIAQAQQPALTPARRER